MARLFLVLNLRIGNRRPAYRTPVDDTVAFINITFVIKVDKNLFNRPGTTLVHRKALSVPVTGGADFL